MNRPTRSATPERTERSPKKHRLSVNALLIAALACAFCLVMFQFARSYGALRGAIQQERMDYVGEISAQLISGHRFMLEEYANSIRRYAGIVDRSRAESLADIAACFIPEEASGIMLISDSGNIKDLNGKNYFTTDRGVVEKLCENAGVTQLFASLNNEDDYWMFATGIEPLRIGDARYGTIVLAIPAGRFGETLAISLFERRGASYIIKRGGSIAVKPDDVGAAFGGYNLFSSLSQSGVSDWQVEELRVAIDEGRTGSILVDVKGHDWLFGYNGIDGENAIVVAVPLTLTAAQTYGGLNNTLIYMATALMLVLLVALAVMLRFFRRDRERAKLAMAAEAKSSFFSKMSHDIRTPLNAIIGLQALIKESDDIPTIRNYNEQSGVASSYLLSILNDVLDMSRIESGGLTLAREEFDMNELLSEVGTITSGMANDKRVAFAVETDERFDTHYLGDAVRVKQVLMNLLNNAVKFTRPGGCVMLLVEHHEKDRAFDEVHIVVRDNGIGISREYLNRIFTPFAQEQSSYTQQYAGSGLGLAIVHSLIAQMGGTIEVESEAGKGSAFTVALPFERGSAISPGRRAVEAEGAQTVHYSGKRVLLAEDNEINQMITARLLAQKFDISTEIASDGRQALDMFSNSEPGYFHLILMDVKMPGMDGLEATKAIRALKRPDAGSVPIVAFSANAYADDVASAIAAGMNGHLAKPIDVGALLRVLEEYLDQ